MKHVMDMLKINEEIARKFLEVESALEPARSPAELLENLVRELGAVFEIPYVWLTFVSRMPDEELWSGLALPESFRERAGTVDLEVLDALFQQETVPVLANENLQPFYKLFPEKRKYFIKSIAVVPLTLRERLIGCINLGDSIPERYCEGMDTSLLQQLAVRISEHLECMVYGLTIEPAPGSGVSERESEK